MAIIEVGMRYLTILILFGLSHIVFGLSENIKLRYLTITFLLVAWAPCYICFIYFYDLFLFFLIQPLRA